jgi:hypothetical protein
LHRRLGGSQGWSGQVQKISIPPGFDPQTVQPTASHYTDYTTRPTVYKEGVLLLTIVSTMLQVAVAYTATANSFIRTILFENARTTKMI